MTYPNDPWAQRPEDPPTERMVPPGEGSPESGEPTLHTSEFYEAYGQQPPPAGPAGTAAYPTYGYGDQGQPPLNATREFPPYDSQWGAYENPWPSGPGQGGPGYPGPGYPGSGGPGSPGEFPPLDKPPPQRNTGLWIALGLATVAVVAIVGVLAGMLLGGDDSGGSDTAAGTSTGPTTLSRVPAPAPGTGGQLPSELPGVPGLGELGDLGATMGTITANDGSTLTIDAMNGTSTKIRTTADTQVISLTATAVAELPVGDMIMVQGDTAQDGTVEAEVIISTAIPGGGR